jgi:hypothetical protein
MKDPFDSDEQSEEEAPKRIKRGNKVQFSEEADELDIDESAVKITAKPNIRGSSAKKQKKEPKTRQYTDKNGYEVFEEYFSDDEKKKAIS